MVNYSKIKEKREKGQKREEQAMEKDSNFQVPSKGQRLSGNQKFSPVSL